MDSTMFLQRVMGHLRQQDWAAIWIDFAIVVVGVFIGIQVANWNNERLDEKRRAKALVLLQAEFSENIRILARRIQADKTRMALHETVVKVVMAGVLEQQDRASFESGLAQYLYFSNVSLQKGAYQALEQSGELTLIDAMDILVALNNFHAHEQWIASQYLSFREGLNTLGTRWNAYVYHQPGNNPYHTDISYDLTGLSQNKVAISAIVEMARMHNIAASYLQGLYERAIEVCGLLAKATLHECIIEAQS